MNEEFRISYFDKLCVFTNNLKNHSKFYNHLNYITDERAVRLALGNNIYTFYNGDVDFNIESVNNSYISFQLSTYYNAIEDILDFIYKYGHYSCSSKKGLEKYFNTKEIIGRNIICMEFYNISEKLIKYYFFNKNTF